MLINSRPRIRIFVTKNMPCFLIGCLISYSLYDWLFLQLCRVHQSRVGAEVRSPSDAVDGGQFPLRLPSETLSIRYCKVTSASTSPLPDFNSVMALPRIAPCAFAGLAAFIA